MRLRTKERKAPALRALLEEAYARYDASWMDPDPVQFVWKYESTEDREVAGLIASSLAYGNVRQIKKSVARVLDLLGPRPARALESLRGPETVRALGTFKHRFNDATDVACLLVFAREMRRLGGSIEGFLSPPLSGEADLRGILVSFVERTLNLSRDGLYGPGALPESAGVRFFFPSPLAGSACKRLCLYLRWMSRSDSVDPGGWSRVPPRALLIPLDAHIINIGREAGLTERVSPGWKMAEDITAALSRCDPEDPVKYDFALHRMGLFKRRADIDGLRRAVRADRLRPAH